MSLEEEECEACSSIGFMFDNEHSKETRLIELAKGVTVTLKTIGDRPGHVQSGQYLWPAAAFGSNFVLDHWMELQSDRVVELGAGCGLLGIAIALYSPATSVVFTDYDYGSLRLIQDNMLLNGLTEESRCAVQSLEWGAPISSQLTEEVKNDHGKFRLVVGTDLVYCQEVVPTLFSTVDQLLASSSRDDEADGIAVTPVFVLVTSFSLEEAIEQEICRVCDRYRLQRHQKVALDESRRVCRVEYYTRRPVS